MYINGKTVFFDSSPVITGSAGVVGKKEGEGPLRNDFDAIFEDTTMGQSSFELAESAMLHAAIVRALSNSGKSPSDVTFAMTGDLLDQCVGSCFALKDLQIPFIGMYGACSTMALTIANAAILVDGGADCCVAAASSHFCSSERQFRFPLEYGGQRPPTAQWTVTGAGAAVVEQENSLNRNDSIKIKAVHIGTITDLGIKDANNMGAAMAPAYVSMVT
jgi:stage V sporulation protein AD